MAQNSAPKAEHNSIGGSRTAHVVPLDINIRPTVEEETNNRGFAKEKKTEACGDLWLDGISEVSHEALPRGALFFVI